MGTQERRQRERGERRASILAAARELFLEQGYTATTVPMIAERAELAPGTLYLYFPSKRALYAELLDEGYALLLGRLRTAVARARTPATQAAALIDAFFAFVREHPAYFDIIFFLLKAEGGEVAGARADDAVTRRLAAGQESCKAIALDVLRRARPEARPGTLQRELEAVWSMLAGVVLYFFRDDEAVFAAMAAEARRLVLRAVLGDGR